MQKFKSEASSEISRIKKAIFQRLSAYRAELAAELYKNLIHEIKSTWQDPSLSIVTTNYDLTFESAVEQVGESEWSDMGITEFDYGFTMRFGRPIYDSTRNPSWPSGGRVEYLKVHGSLDWHRDSQGRCSRSMSNTVPDDPDQMAILYPGFKGVPEIEPFASLHGRLSQRLAEADAVIVIGFAFRDAYINNIFENAMRLRKRLKVYSINPLSLEDHPVESAARRLASHYSGFRHIEREVKLGQFPIGLSDFAAPSRSERESSPASQ